MNRKRGWVVGVWLVIALAWLTIAMASRADAVETSDRACGYETPSSAPAGATMQDIARQADAGRCR